jgi:hypothetical protein
VEGCTVPDQDLPLKVISLKKAIQLSVFEVICKIGVIMDKYEPELTYWRCYGNEDS